MEQNNNNNIAGAATTNCAYGRVEVQYGNVEYE
jgi:hypothetical protein